MFCMVPSWRAGLIFTGRTELGKRDGPLALVAQARSALSGPLRGTGGSSQTTEL
jgi:hypothetical protein